MFAPGDPVPALSKSAIVSGSCIDGDVSTSTRPVSTYEVSKAHRVLYLPLMAR